MAPNQFPRETENYVFETARRLRRRNGKRETEKKRRTPNPPTKSLGFRGFDSSKLLIIRSGILMSVEFYRGSPGKFDSRTLNRKTLNRWTGRNAITAKLQTAETDGTTILTTIRIYNLKSEHVNVKNLRVTPGPNMVLTKLYGLFMTPFPWDPLSRVRNPQPQLESQIISLDKCKIN